MGDALGSVAAADAWLTGRGCPAACGQAPIAEEALCNITPAATKRRRLEAPNPPVYAWLKEAMASLEYRERRRRFHNADLFSHWRRKAQLTFSADNDWKVIERDASSACID